MKPTKVMAEAIILLEIYPHFHSLDTKEKITALSGPFYVTPAVCTHLESLWWSCHIHSMDFYAGLQAHSSKTNGRKKILLKTNGR